MEKIRPEVLQIRGCVPRRAFPLTIMSAIAAIGTSPNVVTTVKNRRKYFTEYAPDDVISAVISAPIFSRLGESIIARTIVNCNYSTHFVAFQVWRSRSNVNDYAAVSDLIERSSQTCRIEIVWRTDEISDTLNEITFITDRIEIVNL